MERKYKFLITSKVRKEIEKQQYSYAIQSYIANLERRTAPFTEKHSLKKSKIFRPRYMGQSAPRFIFFEEKFGDCTIYVLRTLLRHHDEYDDELDDITADTDKYVESYPYTSEEQQEINETLASMKKEPVRLSLPKEFHVFEGKRDFYESVEEYVYESPSWVKTIKTIEDNAKSIIFQTLYNIVCEERQYSLDKPTTIHAGEYDIYALYDISEKILFLLAITPKNNKPDTSNVDKECIKRVARKRYPVLLLTDKESWIDVESDDTSNLALSDEELNILQNAKYPFYVKGLAGSGKSTILYYLFAQAYRYTVVPKMTGNGESIFGVHGRRVIFLSYSKKLTEEARSTVTKILQCRNQYVPKNIDDEQRLKNSFYTFNDFLLKECLTPEERRSFDQREHIDYDKFKQLYSSDKECQLPVKRKYSADLVWSIIRTYIKGKDYTRYLTPSEYATSVNDRQQEVSVETYKAIYTIWNNWYRHYYERGVYYDDLDLVRRVLNKGEEDECMHQFAVIFCDEAQDFTTVETELIIKLSLYTKYDLSQNNDLSIPLAFAGDSNQTVSPTGFRWGSMKDVFNEAIKIKDYNRFSELPLNINYRSKDSIVRFANTIQLIRYKLIPDNTKKKQDFQEAWSVEDNKSSDIEGQKSLVKFYSTNKYQHQIKAVLRDAYIITSGEGEYVELSDIEDSDIKEYGNLDNIYTAISSKGLGLESVLLYKFADLDALKSFKRIIEGESIQSLKDAEKYKLAHFFTKLYIAVSRARQFLFIADTDEAYNIFWRYLMHNEASDKLIRKLGSQKGTSFFCQMSFGDINTLHDQIISCKDDKSLADSLYEEGRQDDPAGMNKLQRAQNLYRTLGYNTEVQKCSAYINQFEKNYDVASSIFASVGMYEDAITNAWNGACWPQILSIVSKFDANKSERYNIQIIIASFLCKKITIGSFISKLYDQYNIFEYYQHIFEDVKLWQKISEQIDNVAEDISDRVISDSFIKKLDAIVSLLNTQAVTYIDPFRASCYYRRGLLKNSGKDRNSIGFDRTYFEKTKRIWDKTGNNTSTGYKNICRMLASSDSEEIKLLSDWNETKEIVRLFGNKNKSMSLEMEAKDIVFNALVQTDLSKAISYPYPASRVRWKRIHDHLWNKIAQHSPNSSRTNKDVLPTKERAIFVASIFLSAGNETEMRNAVIQCNSLAESWGVSKEELLKYFDPSQSSQYQQYSIEAIVQKTPEIKEKAILHQTGITTKLHSLHENLQKTYKLIKANEDIDENELTRKTGWTDRTITNHIQRLIYEGLLNYKHYVTNDEFDSIKKAFNEIYPSKPKFEDVKYRPIYDKLNGQIEYNIIFYAVGEIYRVPKQIEERRAPITKSRTVKRTVAKKEFETGNYYDSLPGDWYTESKNFYEYSRKNHCCVVMSSKGFFLKVLSGGYYFMSDLISNKTYGSIWVRNKRETLVDYDVAYSLDNETGVPFGNFHEEYNARKLTYTDFKTQKSFTVQL